MKRTFAFALAVSTAIVLFGGPAYAAESYTPKTPTDPTLAGSTAVAECDADAPWISYSVELTDPDGQSTADEAKLVLTDGSNTAEIPLGELVDNRLDGRVLWPGASVDADSNPTGWPGWAFENGAWVQTSGNFAWTRGAITARIVVNPEVAVPLAYPPTTPECATGPAGASASAASLPATGSDFPVIPVAFAGAGLLVAGAAVMVARRLRRR